MINNNIIIYNINIINNDMKRFFVYGIYDSSNIIRYIGKGTNKRHKASVKYSKNPLVVKFLKNDTYSVSILASELSEVDAYKEEMRLIHKYGRIIFNTGTLYNISEGGPYSFIKQKHCNKRRDSFPTPGTSIELINIKTGEIKKFISIHQAARSLNTSPVYVYYLHTGKCKSILKQTWRLNNDRPFSSTNSKSIALKNIKNGKIMRYYSRKAAAKDLNININFITHLATGRIPHLNDYKLVDE
jgi:hypothetical protein